MSKSLNYTTELMLCIGGSEGPELKLSIDYNFIPGYPTTYHEPGACDSVELGRIRIQDTDGRYLDCPAWLAEKIEADTELRDTIRLAAIEELAGEASAAAEYKADAARDDAMMERLQ